MNAFTTMDVAQGPSRSTGSRIHISWSVESWETQSGESTQRTVSSLNYTLPVPLGTHMSSILASELQRVAERFMASLPEHSSTTTPTGQDKARDSGGTAASSNAGLTVVNTI